MGLFDNVKCEAPLPDGKPACDFQTKSFPNPYSEEYTITASGRLIRAKPWWTNEGEEVDTKFHGVLNFYGGKGDEWREFNAKFTDGQLVEIVSVKARE